MRLPAILASACGLAISAATTAVETSDDRFQRLHLLSKRSQLPLTLNDSSFTALTSAPRDYAAVVLMTALDPRFSCNPCKAFRPEWELVVRTWIRGDKKAHNRLLFATLDFIDGKNSFRSMGLETAPVLLIFPPTQGPGSSVSSPPLRYEGPPIAETAHAWLVDSLPGLTHPTLKRPFNLARWSSVTTVLLGLATLVVTYRAYIVPVVQSRSLWAAITIISVLLFTSGHMFNQIRRVPYVVPGDRGNIQYIAGGFQSQYGLEIQIIASLYGLLSFSAIALSTKVPRMTQPRAQLAAVLTWSLVMLLLSSFLLSIFRIKNYGYPFTLPPFL